VQVQDRCTGSANVPQAKKFFSMHPMELLEIVLILMQGTCTVCAEYIIGSEIVLDALDETPR
jgi:hypothetical protein